VPRPTSNRAAIDPSASGVAVNTAVQTEVASNKPVGVPVRVAR
jgi:hypothetical protein